MRVGACVRQSGAVEAMVAYYRDLLTGSFDSPDSARLLKPISVPTLSLWSEDDPKLDLAEGEEAWFSGSYRRETVPNAGHFIQREQPGK